MILVTCKSCGKVSLLEYAGDCVCPHCLVDVMTTETKQAKHTPLKEALMRAWVEGWSHSKELNDDGKRVAADDISKAFPILDAAPELLEACKAVLASIEAGDLGGTVLWIQPPYQDAAVHETATERLQAAISKATS